MSPVSGDTKWTSRTSKCGAGAQTSGGGTSLVALSAVLPATRAHGDLLHVKQWQARPGKQGTASTCAHVLLRTFIVQLVIMYVCVRVCVCVCVSESACVSACLRAHQFDVDVEHTHACHAPLDDDLGWWAWPTARPRNQGVGWLARRPRTGPTCSSPEHREVRWIMARCTSTASVPSRHLRPRLHLVSSSSSTSPAWTTRD